MERQHATEASCKPDNVILYGTAMSIASALLFRANASILRLDNHNNHTVGSFSDIWAQVHGKFHDLCPIVFCT